MNPDAFLTICNTYVGEATLSVGWTTTADGNKVNTQSHNVFVFHLIVSVQEISLISIICFPILYQYSQDMVETMYNILERNDCINNGKKITFPARAILLGKEF